MMDLQKSLPVVLSALVVLVLGCLNPKLTQERVHGKPAGHQSYMLLALAALVVGLLTQMMMKR